MKRQMAPNILTGLILLIMALMTDVFAQVKSDYVGSDMCKQCHEILYDTYLKSMHGKKNIAGSPEKGEGCESCHGPGSAHIEKGGGKNTIISFGKENNLKEKASMCLKCHGDSKQMAFWDMSRHKRAQVACDSCHTIHKSPKTIMTSTITPATYQRGLLKAPTPDLCYSCHQDVRSQTLRQSRHPIRERLMTCFDCHNTHGGFGPKMIKTDTVNELCYKCHAAKRGPFMFGHPPVQENCLACHVPHGGNHNALLVSKTPHLCQSCHDWRSHPGSPNTSFETFKGRNPSNRMFSRNCLLCHPNVHGSNSPTSRGQNFLR
jgi:DmsE family decaheme c-type cytochrome